MSKSYLVDELSVFFPCYNEEANILSTFNKALPIIKEITPKWEVVLVNDGSKDKTGEIVEKIRSEYPNNVKVITHNPNRGYGAAFKSGIYNSSYKWITFTDADGQFDFNEIRQLISKQKETNADLVIGYYLGRKVPFVRILGSTVWQILVFILFGLRVRDIDCGFKLFKKEVVDSIPRLQAERGPFISSEFLINSKKKGYKIIEIGVNHFERNAGKATGANLNVVIAGFKDLFTLWYKMNFTKSYA